ncbi:MAG: NifU N-terminal domain-containing protein, partial [bacterium]
MYEETSFRWSGKNGLRIRVGVEPSYTHANVCRFVVDPAVYPGGALHVPASDTKGYSPLAKRLLDLGGINEVLIAGDTVTVTTETLLDWEELAPRVAEAIRDQIDSDVPSVYSKHAETLPSSDVIREKVRTLIDTAINPAIAGHGGSVTLTDVQGNNIYLEFGGGCQGCG